MNGIDTYKYTANSLVLSMFASAGVKSALHFNQA
jgi:hypothetical protein